MVKYDNVRTNDLGEPHETLRGETPLIHLDKKGTERAHEVRIASTKEK
jgi:hypothetical protein